MASYKAPLTDMQFLLEEVFDAAGLFASMPETEEVSADLIRAILEEMGKMAESLLAPINGSGDQLACQFEGGRVTTPPGFKEAYDAYAEGGWTSLTGAVEYGGQGMPKLLSAMIEEIAFGANSSFALYTVLTTGATLVLKLHGSEELRRSYLPPMYAGRWSGTMCLTEPHAGTDLGLIRTRATPRADNSYSLTGTKIFITAGEHDLTENIIHLVLAKLPDAPAGPAGISLFLVPKLVVDGQGGLTDQSNNVLCGSIEHKMGIKASATCVMNFEDSQAFLVGEPNKGLAQLFSMMNYERLTMGLQGNGLAENSFQVASEYAKERLQGRAASGPVAADKAADPIIVHPDVRRMLLTMRANIMAGRALSIFSASQLDIARFHPDAEARAKAERLVAFLIPVQKAYCSDRGYDSCTLGQQVLGGHGYVAEWGLEQNVRDARIAQIYEGANGIQALDLMGRKTVRSNGALLQELLEALADDVADAASRQALAPQLAALKDCQGRLEACAREVIDAAGDDPDAIGAASYPFLELAGLTLFAFMWLRIMEAAHTALEQPEADQDYLLGLIHTGEFFFARMLPRSTSLAQEIAAGSATLMAMAAEQF